MTFVACTLSTDVWPVCTAHEGARFLKIGLGLESGPESRTPERR